jgi:hypothetical protein
MDGVGALRAPQRISDMRAIASLGAGLGLLLASCAASPTASGNRDAELAKAVAGRVAGEPVNCITLRDIKTSRIIDGLAIIYTMTNGTIYVNRPTSGASSLNTSDILVSDTHSGQLCSIDIVRLRDSALQTDSGSVGLGKFVPYPRADRHDR